MGGIISFIIGACIQIYILIIILQVLMSWLIAFEIVNKSNEAAQNLTALLKRLTDPVYQPIRKYVPPLGGIDITPLIVLIGVQLLGAFLLSIF